MYGYAYNYGYGSNRFNIEKALLKFTTWHPTTNIDGTREIVNEGSANNLTLYSGSGTSFNGTNQSVDGFVLPLDTTHMIYLKDNVKVYTTTLIDFSTIVSVGTYKDVYYFNRALTTTEQDKYTSQPEQFYIDALADNTCVLNMPMNDKGSTAHDYVSNTDYPKLNYTTDQNISNLQYGTQDLKLPHDDLGLRDGTITPWIKGDGVGEWSNSLSTNDIGQIFTIQLVFKRPILSENIYLLKGQNGISGIQLDLNRTWADSDIRLYIFNSSGSSAQTIPNVLDEYTHIIFTYDGTTLKGYKNGVYQGQVTIQLDTNSNPIFEGLVTPETLKLCEIRNDKALTQEEVATAYNDAVNKGLLA